MLPIKRLIPPDTTRYDATITIRLTFEQRDLINAVADQLGVCSSTLARHILEEVATTLREELKQQPRVVDNPPQTFDGGSEGIGA